ncbi:hypothetical protein [Clostridiisalibacter paucivorans]|uniref:hypothetical protein n=1 Tax=Clostridiisalibacter paucivorans TaxID=408753 RepID=UPI0012EC90B0|nr:hypothetical protein [Clostridiisalibacter paucivorans]
MDVKEIENFIKKIQSVMTCKAISNESDEIIEMHILADINRSAKQLSRDVQTGLVSKFGIKIDHRKISIAQIDQKTIRDMHFRLRVHSISLTTTATKAVARVILARGEDIFEGQAVGPNTEFNVKKLFATATLRAVERFLNIEEKFILEDIKTVALAGKDVIVTAIAFLSPMDEEAFCGCAFVGKDFRESIVKSTLDGINRRIIKLYNLREEDSFIGQLS